MFKFRCTSEKKFSTFRQGKPPHLIRYGFPESDKHNPKSSLKEVRACTLQISMLLAKYQIILSWKAKSTLGMRD